jgi:hypothetical protein
MHHCPKHPSVVPCGPEYAKKIISENTVYPECFQHTRAQSFFWQRPGIIYGSSVGCGIYIELLEQGYLQRSKGGERQTNADQ